MEIFVFILGLLAVCGIIYLATQDAPKRGFSEGQVFLLRVACVIFFPVAIILYLILKPSLKQA
jgi:hypothetical protein